MHLIPKQIPEPVKNAAEELSVAQQRSGKHRGPHVLPEARIKRVTIIQFLHL